jgi:hypothetical protein
MVLIENGEMREANFGLPKLRIETRADKPAKASKSGARG